VARALERLLDSKDKLTRQGAARALAVWCTADSLPALARALDDESPDVAVAALEGLGKIDDHRAIAPIAALIKARKHRSAAVEALSARGALAEDAALDLLAETDFEVRFDACQVLKSVGGAKSVKPLERTSQNDADAIVRIMASRALDEIRDKDP
jgi:HEAT repeat protein